jgi:hypothetical protein
VFSVDLYMTHDDRDWIFLQHDRRRARDRLTSECTEWTSHAIGSRGAHRFRVRAVVDPNFEVAESDERNNEFLNDWDLD